MACTHYYYGGNATATEANHFDEECGRGWLEYYDALESIFTTCSQQEWLKGEGKKFCSLFLSFLLFFFFFLKRKEGKMPWQAGKGIIRKTCIPSLPHPLTVYKYISCIIYGNVSSCSFPFPPCKKVHFQTIYFSVKYGLFFKTSKTWTIVTRSSLCPHANRQRTRSVN